MFTVYVYALDTLADWELGYVTAELNSGRFFKQDAPLVSVKTVGISKEPIKTMGGLTIIPDCVVDEIAVNEKSVLLLPGANTWEVPKHDAVIVKQVNFFPQAQWYAPFVVRQLCWQMRACWMKDYTPAME